MRTGAPCPAKRLGKPNAHFALDGTTRTAIAAGLKAQKSDEVSRADVARLGETEHTFGELGELSVGRCLLFLQA